jgi:hypothetical protein
MRAIIILLAIAITGCATHQAPTRQLDRMYVDCANKRQQVEYLERLLASDSEVQMSGWDQFLTKIDSRHEDKDIEYRKRIKSLLWEVRSQCVN